MGFLVRSRIGLRALLGVALLWASAGLAVGQQTTLVVPPAPLLPQQIGKWKLMRSEAGSAKQMSLGSLDRGCAPQFKVTEGVGLTADAPDCKAILTEHGLNRYAI